MKERSDNNIKGDGRQTILPNFSLSSQNFEHTTHPNVEDFEEGRPYHQTTTLEEQQTNLNEDLISIDSKFDDVYGTVNINKYITGKRMAAGSRNSSLGKLDIKGFKT